MGTNYYLKEKYNEDGDNDDPAIHVGKCSFNGVFCWKCRQKLVSNGSDYLACPNCGRKVKFRLDMEDLPDGIKRACSFTWAMHADDASGKKIIDTYGREYTWDEFVRDVLDISPIRSVDHVGEWFS